MVIFDSITITIKLQATVIDPADIESLKVALDENKVSRKSLFFRILSSNR